MDCLRLLLQFERKDATSDPFAFRFEPQDYILPSQDGEAAEAHFPWSATLASELDALRKPGRPAQLVTHFAEVLRKFVDDAGWSSYVQRIESARAAGQSVELLIRSAAAEIYALPWELLSLRPGGPCLGELANVLLRYAWPACPVTPEAPQPRPEGGGILLAWSAAGGAVPVREHADAIGRACQLGSHPFVRDPLRPDSNVLPHASVRTLLRRLEAARSTGQPISVLHLLCHGTESQGSFGLCLDGQEGQAVADGYELRQVLAPFSDMVRLVVLSACDSGNTGAMGCAAGSVAQSLHRVGFASVIGSRFPLSALGSIAFCQTFYQTLLTGPDSLERAFLAARSALAEAALEQAQRDRPLDWASLQLYGHPPLERDTRPVVFRPYRGLLAFGPEHRRLFFGRDAESAEILGDLQNLERENKPRFLVVAGASGTGKSSVVLASAVPRLLEQSPGVQLHVIRPGNAPLAALQQGLTEATGPLLLVVDQFEELFTQTATPAERQAFVQALWRLACQAAPLVRVIITLRVDFVGQCGELLLSPSGPRLDRVAFDETHRVFIAQQEPAQLQQCIEQPAFKMGLELEAGLVAALLSDVGNEPGALPLLEDALDMLWLRRQGARLTHKAFAEIGGVVGALEKRADALVDALPTATQPLVRRLLTDLVTVSEQGGSDTRRPRPLAELRSQIAADTAASPEVLQALLHKLCHERLLVLTHSGSTAQVELAHEALIRRWRRLRTWLDEDRAALLAERRIQGDAERWQQQQQESSLLYRGAELLQATAWRTARSQEGRRPSPLLATFLSASEAQEDAEAQQKQAAAQQLEAERQQKLRAAQTLARRTRQAAAVFAVLALVASGIGIVAWQQYESARHQTELASQRLTEAIGVADTLVFNIDRRLRSAPGTSELRKEVLQDAAGLLDKLRPDSKDDPRLLRAREVGHMQRGDLALTHDNVELAQQEYEQALKLSEELAQADSQDAQAQRDLAISLNKLGDVAVQRGELAEAKARYERSLGLSEKRAQAEPQDVQAQRDLSISLNRLGDVAVKRSELAEAKARYERSLGLREKRAQADPHDAQAQRDLSISLDNLGDVAVQRGELTEAKARYERSLSLSEKRAQADPQDAQAQRNLSISLNKLGDVAVKRHALAEAKSYYERSLSLSEKRAQADPQDAQAQRDLSISLGKMADIAMRQNHLDEAETLVRRSYTADLRLAAVNPLSLDTHRDLLADHIQLAQLLRKRGQWAAAYEEAKAAAVLLEKLRPRLSTADADNLNNIIRPFLR